MCDVVKKKMFIKSVKYELISLTLPPQKFVKLKGVLKHNECRN